MNTEYLYLVAEQLYLNASGHPMCNRNWIAAIYKSLLVANRGDAEEILWTKYNEWKIDHNCRAARSTAKTNKSKIISFNMVPTDLTAFEIVVTIQKGTDVISKTIIYKKDAFPEGLWRVKNPKNDTVLSNQFERDQLFEESLSSTSYFAKLIDRIMDREIVTENDLDVDIPNTPDKLDISLYSDLDGDEQDQHEVQNVFVEKQVDTISSVI